jgi:hypothetical protein
MTSRRMQDAKIGLYDIVTSTTLESNKSDAENRVVYLSTADNSIGPKTR